VSNAVDWTVDKALSAIKTLNARAQSAQNTIRANRAAYREALLTLPSVPDLGSREALRARLRDWIHRQVDVENRFNAFASRYLAAKAAVKRFLESIGVSPPAYLGAAPLVVPAAVYGGLAIAFAVIATIYTLNASQTRGLNGIRQLLETARERNWTAQETAAALKSLAEATASTTPDPLGLKATLEAALPLLVIGAVIFFVGPMLQRRRVAA